MAREIGSEFWDVPQTEKSLEIFPQNVQWVLSGRAALSCIIEDILVSRPLRSVALPSWCCESMIQPFLAAGLEVYFYPVYVDNAGYLRQDIEACPPCDVVLLLNYFGYSHSSLSPKVHGIRIWDATHSIFSGIPDGVDYVFGSLRKWAGFWTGGFAFARSAPPLPSPSTACIQAERYIALRQQGMDQKRTYLANGGEKYHLDTFASAEDLLEHGASGCAAPEDISAALHLDIDFLRQKRRANAAVLLEYVSHLALFPELSENDCPLFVPIRVPGEKRDALRRHLIEQSIYCPIHWPVSPLHNLTEQTRLIYDEELSLVCDQRYTAKDMHRIGQAVREFLEGADGI